MADLATELERQLTTGKHAEGTKHDFRCPICRSATGQATIVVRFSGPSSTDVPSLLLNHATVISLTRRLTFYNCNALVKASLLIFLFLGFNHCNVQLKIFTLARLCSKKN